MMISVRWINIKVKYIVEISKMFRVIGMEIVILNDVTYITLICYVSYATVPVCL